VDASRLRLRVADLSIVDAALAGSEALSRALGGYEVAEGWVVFPQALPVTREALAADPGSARWGTRLFVVDEPKVVVGWGGFKGPPAEGVVELGYAVAPDFRGRGIAGEAVRQMLLEAFSSSEVQAVIAHTLGQPGPSTRVLEKAGFGYDGEATDGDGGVLWRWRHERR
jgi:[ribosomal protein S5]-alanine N-acetyltransferase